MLFFLMCSALCCHFSEVYIFPSSALLHFLLGLIVFLVVIFTLIIKEDWLLAFIVAKMHGSMEEMNDIEEKTKIE